MKSPDEQRKRDSLYISLAVGFAVGTLLSLSNCTQEEGANEFPGRHASESSAPRHVGR